MHSDLHHPATPAVVPFPVDRALVRRRAMRDADAGLPITACPFGPTDVLAYEHAYNEHARQIAGEIAECA